MMDLTLKAMDWDLSMMRFDTGTQFDAEYINAPGFKNIGRTDDEVTVICDTAHKPAQMAQKCVDGWKAFKVVGPLDFALVGILNAITAVLAQASISVVAVSTYDTDIVLVSGDNFEKAKTALGQKFKVI